MTPEAKRGDALQFIFSLFLGVLLLVFVGVGVWTFYPEPRTTPEAQAQLDRLYQEQARLDGKYSDLDGTRELLPAEEKRREEVRKKLDALQKISENERNTWTRNTSIVLLAFATVFMAISLTLPEAMKVFSNGLLLGGMFTLIYGTGWSFAGGDSRARFYVVAVALLLSVGFGYLRFIRRKRAQSQTELASTASAVGEGPAVDTTALSDLGRRVADLEHRVSAAAAALAPDVDE